MTGHEIDPKFGVPILGTAKTGPNAPGLTANCDLYDEEIDKIHRIIEALNDKYVGKRSNYAEMQQEIEDRFHAIGLKTSVGWWTTNLPDVLLPEITITDRTERHDFDHDQKVHEITNDVLGLGDKGVIASGDLSQFTGGHAGHGH